MKMELEVLIQEAARNPAVYLKELYGCLLVARLFVPTMDAPPSDCEYTSTGNESLRVVLGRDARGEPLNIMFTSIRTMSRWARGGRPYAELPSTVLFKSLRGTQLRTVIDPSGPVSFELTSTDIETLAAGKIPEG